MFLIVVDHAPRQRNKFPHNWQTIGPQRVAVITPDGDYWYEHCKRMSEVLKVRKEDLRTGHIAK